MVNLQVKLWAARIAQDIMHLITDEYVGFLPKDCGSDEAAPIEKINKLGT